MSFFFIIKMKKNPKYEISLKRIFNKLYGGFHKINYQNGDAMKHYFNKSFCIII